MSAVHALTAIAVLTYLLLVGAIVFLIRERVWREMSELLLGHISTHEDSDLPEGARIYWSVWTGRKCSRCNNGKIARRYRFQIIGKREGKVVLRELRGIYWCDGCNYRGLSITKTKEKKTNGRPEAKRCSEKGVDHPPQKYGEEARSEDSKQGQG